MDLLVQYIPILCSVVIGAIVVALIIPRLLLIALKRRLLDQIDSRKIHTVRTSRLGGASFLVAMLCSIALVMLFAPLFGVTIYSFNAQIIYLFAALLTMYLLGLYDDLYGVQYKYKFLFQILASVFVLISGLSLHNFHGLFAVNEISNYISYPLTVLIIVYVINAINLIDGLDGLAASLALMALLVYGALLFVCGDFIAALIAFSTFGALSSFLYFNLFRVRKRITTKVIMGDSGSLVIGMVLGILVVKLWNIMPSASISNELATRCHLLSFTMLLIPCLDVLRVMLHRLKRNRPLFLPDKNHFHHKLLELGLSHRKALIYILIVNLVFISINVLLIAVLTIPYIIVIDLVLWTILHIIISRNIRIHKSGLNE